MSIGRKTVIILVLIFIAIQFVQPSRNSNTQLMQADLLSYLKVPDTIATVIKASCYDCHSNNTSYPWYAGIQPFGWIMSNHIKEAKEELNCSVFGDYPVRRQLSKLKGMSNSVKDGSMPLKGYVFLHPGSGINERQKLAITKWAANMVDSISNIKK